MNDINDMIDNINNELPVGRITSMSQARRITIQQDGRLQELKKEIEALKAKHVEEINNLMRVCLELQTEIAKKDEEIRKLKK